MLKPIYYFSSRFQCCPIHVWLGIWCSFASWLHLRSITTNQFLAISISIHVASLFFCQSFILCECVRSCVCVFFSLLLLPKCLYVILLLARNQGRATTRILVIYLIDFRFIVIVTNIYHSCASASARVAHWTVYEYVIRCFIGAISLLLPFLSHIVSIVTTKQQHAN